MRPEILYARPVGMMKNHRTCTAPAHMHAFMQASTRMQQVKTYQVNYQSREISHIQDVGFHGWRLDTPFHHKKLQHFNLNEITSRMIHIAILLKKIFFPL